MTICAPGAANRLYGRMRGTMFGGKREKALEEELAEVSEENAHARSLLTEIAGKRDDIQEEFARMTASHAQMSGKLGRMGEQMDQLFALTQESEPAAGGVSRAVSEIAREAERFADMHTAFLENIRRQNGKIESVVEKNKHFTTPMKYITELPAALREDHQAIYARGMRMSELSRNMSVLSLNTAIEAGRMGESGRHFVAAAEEVRAFSEQYEQEAAGLLDELFAEKKRVMELEEQVHRLNELLKENNISMGKLYKDCQKTMASYEEEQSDLHALVEPSLPGRADALRQFQEESLHTQKRVLRLLEAAQKELEEYKSCTDELETVCKDIQKTAECVNP